MKSFALSLAAASLFAAPALAFDMKVEGVGNNQPISPEYAFCQKDGSGKTKDADNYNPAIAWWDAPKGTKSFALLVVDKDVPQSFDNANQEGKSIAEDAPRQDFYHWVLVDIPATADRIGKGTGSEKLVKTGKPVGKTEAGITGANSFGSFMKGTFGGYDGPCPPFNDERIHHYHFQLYALDTASLGLSGNFTGQQAKAAIDKHLLAKAESVGTYTTNASR